MIRIKKKLRQSKQRPRVAFFELSSCEGCQLQLLNRETSLLRFLGSIDIVHFREGMSVSSNNYSIAFVEGSVNSDEQEKLLSVIRAQAQMVVALGSCACFGGINQLAQACLPASLSGAGTNQGSSRPLDWFIKVDEYIYGCPVKKQEVEQVLQGLVKGEASTASSQPVCRECQQHDCLLDQGQPCLGPVTRGGCDAWCTAGNMACWGCRGPAPLARPQQLQRISQRAGVDAAVLQERLSCFGGFNESFMESVASAKDDDYVSS